MVNSQPSSVKKRVTLIAGDGIGPEVTLAARRIIEAVGAAIEWDEREAGAEVFKRGLPSGVPPETIESIRRTRVVLKGPLATPVGYGEKSANVTLRKLFETYGNIRPVRELPGVPTPYTGRGVDLVVVRENIEDLYAGIEYMQTPGVAEGLKLISRKGCEKIVRLAFEFARSEGRERVACATKSNIMKLTEGMLKRTFEEIAPEYADVQASHIIIDNCAHQLVKRPEQFDVIVTTNMNGDIISDLSSALVGGLGFAPSANLGNDVAIFEAVHGSAPKYAGKDVINPTAVILSSVMMLRHLSEFEAAETIENAVLVTLEEGKARTGDVVGYEKGVSTSAYTDAIIANLGRKTRQWRVRAHKPLRLPTVPSRPDLVTPKTLKVTGVDVFLDSAQNADQLGPELEQVSSGTPFKLKLISNRGTKVYPAVGAITDCVDHWRCRFVSRSEDVDFSDDQVADLVRRVSVHHHWIQLQKLLEIDGKPGFTKDQGEN
ncbi:MAG: NADP-dependent isocitrate dehydrogenase [Terriglobia bacterium]